MDNTNYKELTLMFNIKRKIALGALPFLMAISAAHAQVDSIFPGVYTGTTGGSFITAYFNTRYADDNAVRGQYIHLEYVVSPGGRPYVWVTGRAAVQGNPSAPLQSWYCIVRENTPRDDSTSPFRNFRRAALVATDGTLLGIKRDSNNICTTVNIHKNIQFQH